MSAPDEALARIEYVLEGCAVVTLNRPEAMNALSVALRRRLVHVFEGELARRARVVVLTGAGAAFCAGLDLNELCGDGQDIHEMISSQELDVTRAIRAFNGPVIGAVNGSAITGGFELALACDFLLAGETARFADTHVRIGVLPSWGLSQLLQRRIGEGRAKQLSLTGNFLDARRALEWGLVNEVLPSRELVPAAIRLAGDMLSAEPETLRAYRRLINDGAELPLGAALALEQERASTWAAKLTPDHLAQLRAAVLARGRTQSAVPPKKEKNE